MASKNRVGTTLIDCIRPSAMDGPLVGGIFATYGLSLDQPDFFGQDFLPTLLGLGSIRNRGYTAPATLDRALANSDITLVCDAHAVAAGDRPTLRVDVLPIGRKVHHAKVLLIHRRNHVRLVIASANLTHEGFRRQREVAAVLDFRAGGALSAAILDRGASRWLEVLGEAADDQFRSILNNAVAKARSWTSNGSTDEHKVEIVFGGGAEPLWRTLVDAWPENEPVEHWQICSPFWPQAQDESGRTPFEAIADGLMARQVSLEQCELEVIACADSPTALAVPKFPYQLIRQLRARNFPVRRGRIMAAKMACEASEVPEGMNSDRGTLRTLHAKWTLLAGPQTVVAMLGSANFTRRGQGVLNDPTAANIEACVLLKWPRGQWNMAAWRPPVHDRFIDWEKCGEQDLAVPPSEEDVAIAWPQFINRIELFIRWENLPEADGELRIHLHEGLGEEFQVGFIRPHDAAVRQEGMTCSSAAGSPSVATITPAEVRSTLARRAVCISWDLGQLSAIFPVNILHESKASMPSVLGAKPTEEQLLAYFHGRISEEELLARLEQQSREGASVASSPIDIERLRRLQSYIVREFVEGLYGLADLVRDASFSPRAAEQALLGDMSPVALAEQVCQAFDAGRRSPTAAAFQLAELLRTVAELSWSDAVLHDHSALPSFEMVRNRAIERIFATAAKCVKRQNFGTVFADEEFIAFVRAMLPNKLAARWLMIGHTAKVTSSIVAELAEAGERP